MPRRRTATLTPAEARRHRQQLARNETSEHREQRLNDQRNRSRQNRADVREQQRAVARDQQRAGASADAGDDPLLGNAANEFNRRRLHEGLPRTYACARLFRNDSGVLHAHDVGRMNKLCEHCDAKLYTGEVIDQSSSICCHKGKIRLHIPDCPHELQLLIEKNDHVTANYIDNIRHFNSALAFASVQLQAVPIPGRGPVCIKIHGQVYHFAGSLQPSQGKKPTYAGLFLLDFEEALQDRIQHPLNERCDSHLMATLQGLIERINPYAQIFRFVKDTAKDAPNFTLKFTKDNAFDQRRYNAPTANEVAAVFVSEDGAPPGDHQFLIHHNHTRNLTTISNLNSHSDPLCYPLLLPSGDAGWRPDMPHVNIHATAVRQTTTQLQYYAYYLAVRGHFNLLHSSGKQFQQYIVDSFVKVEGSRIAYIKNNQKNLRADTYAGLMDFLQSEARQQGLRAGVPVILPSSFLGSPRNMLQNYQDAMSIVSRYGRPDIFLTMTCNPRWPEITAELQPFQKVEHRPDLVTRVFHLKLKAIIADITKLHIFGVVVAFVYVIEFQKRELPHVRILIILRNVDKLRDT